MIWGLENTFTERNLSNLVYLFVYSSWGQKEICTWVHVNLASKKKNKVLTSGNES